MTILLIVIEFQIMQTKGHWFQWNVHVTKHGATISPHSFDITAWICILQKLQRTRSTGAPVSLFFKCHLFANLVGCLPTIREDEWKMCTSH